MRLIILLMLVGCSTAIPTPPKEFGTLTAPVETLWLGWDTDGDGEVDLRVYYGMEWTDPPKRSHYPWKIEYVWKGTVLRRTEYDWDMDGEVDHEK